MPDKRPQCNRDNWDWPTITAQGVMQDQDVFPDPDIGVGVAAEIRVLQKVCSRGRADPGRRRGVTGSDPRDDKSCGLVAGGAIHLTGGRYHDIQEGARQVGCHIDGPNSHHGKAISVAEVIDVGQGMPVALNHLYVGS